MHRLSFYSITSLNEAVFSEEKNVGVIILGMIKLLLPPF